MSWIPVKKFPLDADLSQLAGYLQQRSIVFRIYEESSLQILAVQDERLVIPVQKFIDDLDHHRIHIKEISTSTKKPFVNVSSLISEIKDFPLTSLLIFLSVLGALLVTFDVENSLTHWLTFQEFYKDPFSSVRQTQAFTQPWRLITPAFLHFGFLHILFNSLWTWELGRRLELFLGQSKFIIFFLLTSMASNVAQYCWAPNNLFGGMSGVIYAMVGFIIVVQKLAPHRLVAVPQATLIFMVVWLFICMTGAVEFVFGSGVANAAHLGGLVAGALFAYVGHQFNWLRPAAE